MSAYLEYRSWIDNGDKAIFLPDGSGYIIKTGSNPKDRKVKIFQLRLNQEQQERLERAFSKNKFDNVAREVVSRCTDGTDMFYYHADREGYHKVHQYMQENAALTAVRGDLLKVISEAEHGQPHNVPVEEMISRVKTQMLQFKEASPQRLCLADILNKVVRGFVGSQQLDYELGKEFMLKDKYW